MAQLSANLSKLPHSRVFLAHHFGFALIMITANGFFQRSVVSQTIPRPDTAIGDSPLAAYDISSIDNVNPANGNLFLNIPLVGFPQMGKSLRLDFKIYYNDKAWAIKFNPPTNQPSQKTGTWQLSVAQGAYVARDQHLDFETITATANTSQTNGPGSTGGGINPITQYGSFFVRDASGAAHYLADWAQQSCSTYGPYSGSCPQTYGLSTNIYPALDGSGYVSSGSPFGSSYSVVDREGVTYSGTTSPTSYVISDRSGNTITSTASGWSDSVSRLIPGSTNGPGQPVVQDYSDVPTDLMPGVQTSDLSRCPSGTQAARIWSLPATGGQSATYYLCYATKSYSSSFNINQYFPNAGFTVAEGSGSAQVLTAVVLPNGTMYTLTYDSALSLSNLGLPSGGSVSYSWQNVPFYLQNTPYTPTSGTNAADSSPVSRALQTRTVTPAGTGSPMTWSYQWVIQKNSQGLPDYTQPAWSIVTDPLGNDTEHLLSNYGSLYESGRYTYQGCGPHNPNCTSGGGALLESQTYSLDSVGMNAAGQYSPAWVAGSFAPLEPTTTTTTFPTSYGNFVSKSVALKTPAYGGCTITSMPPAEPGNSNPPQSRTVSPCYRLSQNQSQAVYDYGNGAAGSLISTTTTNFLWNSGTTNTKQYQAANLLDLPLSVVVTDGSSTPVVMAETDYAYDENNGSPQGAYGNLTTTTRVNTKGTSMSVQGIYNNQGVITSLIDGRGNSTGVTYQCSGSLPFVITNPLSQQYQYGYDCGTGLLTQVQDPNDLAANRAGTQFSYDAMRNPIAVTRPDGGSTSISYQYSAPVNVSRTVKATPSPDVVTSTTYDGLLRPTQQVNADSTTTETVYDLLGRVKNITNPHTSNPASTDGSTSFVYDALGRKTLQTSPDQSTRQWCYGGMATNGQTSCAAPPSAAQSGMWNTQTDELGNAWEQVSDGGGRLVAVGEPGGLVTNYGYDALSNIIAVAQLGIPGTDTPRNRSFSYDSLSRLLSTTNPETGLIQYGSSGCGVAGYDGNGNLTCRLDARQIQTTFAYDALNRLTNKSYTKARTNSFPLPNYAISYSYDSIAGVQTPNAIGRLVSDTMWLSNAVTHSILKYDPMGRVVQESQCGWAALCSQNPFITNYTYDLAGRPVYSDNGVSSMGIGLTSSYDGAGRLKTITSTWDDASHPEKLFGPVSGISQYGPAGLLNAAYATPSGTSTDAFRTSLAYDQRFRVTGQQTGRNDPTKSGTGSTATLTIAGQEGVDVECPGGNADPDQSQSQPPKCTTLYDAGTVGVSVNGFSAKATYGKGSTAATLAKILVAALNQQNSPVQATANGANVTMVSVATGSAANYPISATDGDDFYFSATASSMTGGTDGAIVPLYGYSISSNGGYAANGNLLTVSDSVMGNWNYQYDQLNRLISGTASANPQTGYAPYGSVMLTWSYDSFGNYGGQSASGSSSAMMVQPNYTYTGANGPKNQADGYNYFLSGELMSDGVNIYGYDPEDHIVTVNNQQEYIYNASGQRVAKLDISGSSPVLTNLYILGRGGEQVSELDGNGAWVHSNAWAGGKLLATYNSSGLHFHVTDWLGTLRLQLSATAAVEETCQSLPFGDSLQCSGSDTTEHHFTGKERDAESGLDYFGARYYASNMGRFMSPDWAAKAEAVPYANLSNPQTLNLYAYVGNNPLSRTDPTGHYVCSGTKDQCAQIQTGLNLAKAAQDKLGAKSTGGKAIGAVLKFYGAAGEKNGVNVSFGALKPGVVGQESSGGQGVTNIKFDLGQINNMARSSDIGGVFSMSERAATEIHEGEHGVDDMKRGYGTDSRSALNVTEHNAYRSESYVFQGLGVNSAQGLWSTAWAPGQAESNRNAAVDSNAARSVAGDCAGGGCKP